MDRGALIAYFSNVKPMVANLWAIAIHRGGSIPLLQMHSRLDYPTAKNLVGWA